MIQVYLLFLGPFVATRDPPLSPQIIPLIYIARRVVPQYRCASCFMTRTLKDGPEGINSVGNTFLKEGGNEMDRLVIF